jgi:hypothetical protein
MAEIYGAAVHDAFEEFLWVVIAARWRRAHAIMQLSTACLSFQEEIIVTTSAF